MKVLHLTYYNCNRLPDEFTTIQAQIEIYILNLTRAERNLRRKYYESNNTKQLQTALRLAKCISNNFKMPFSSVIYYYL